MLLVLVQGWTHSLEEINLTNICRYINKIFDTKMFVHKNYLYYFSVVD